MTESTGNISFVGRSFNRRQLFAPSVRLVAERLAFPVSYSQATRRLDSFVKDYAHRDFQNPSVSPWMRTEPIDPLQQAQGLVWNIDSGYDNERENTLEQVAALVARYPNFLKKHGISSDEVRKEMLLLAVEREVNRVRVWVRETHADYYRRNLRAFRAIAHDLRGLEVKAAKIFSS